MRLSPTGPHLRPADPRHGLTFGQDIAAGGPFQRDHAFGHPGFGVKRFGWRRPAAGDRAGSGELGVGSDRLAEHPASGQPVERPTLLLSRFTRLANYLGLPPISPPLPGLRHPAGRHLMSAQALMCVVAGLGQLRL
ncbi:hypothetical protein [Roseicyclus mahoneyensis]|uniref:hypothetical protein n=1 Tax=Roseicyclus mahoneyensis TaxID=164332 RepID=UPI000D6AF755|nr:hypothetical protein [Roseicyclus mahoneyensis]